MMTGERRPVSGRRGMTVLGKIPAVPKPINLPSQRLENGGLDVNVMIVPRGSLSWGVGSRSPAVGNPWGNSAHYSSPTTTTAGSCRGQPAPGTGIATAGNWGSWRGQSAGTSSTGSSTGPSALSSCPGQEVGTAPNAWAPEISRPSSASGVLGRAQSEPTASRPRSAETRTHNSQAPPSLTRFADHTDPNLVSFSGNKRSAGARRNLDEESHQAAQFMLTCVDFPTLGSEKNPDLRPQLNKIGCTPGEHTASVGEGALPVEDRPPIGPAAAFELSPALCNLNEGQDTRPDGWRREARPYGWHAGSAEDDWRGDGSPLMPSFGQSPMANAWQGEAGHRTATAVGHSDDKWRRRAAPPVVPRGPSGSGRFQPQPSSFMLRHRNSPLPGISGRAVVPVSGGYGRQDDNNGSSGPSDRPKESSSRPRLAMDPGVFEGLGSEDNFYGSPGTGYGNMAEQETAVVGVDGRRGAYLNFPQGQSVGAFSRHSHADPWPMSQRHRNDVEMHVGRSDPVEYRNESYQDRVRRKEFTDGGRKIRKKGTEAGQVSSYQSSGESERMEHVNSITWKSELLAPCPRGGRISSHRDWGAAVCSDEPMDFSKPVFEEDTLSGLATSAENPHAIEVGVDDVDMAQANCDGESEALFLTNCSTKTVELTESTKGGFAATTKVKESVFLQPCKRSDECQNHHLQAGVYNEANTGIPDLESGMRAISLIASHDEVTNGGGQLSDPAKDGHSFKSSKGPTQTTGEESAEEFSLQRETVAGGIKGSSTPMASPVKATLPPTAGKGQSVSGGLYVKPTTVSTSEGALCSSGYNEDISKDGPSTKDLGLPSVCDKHVPFRSSGKSSPPSVLDEHKFGEEVRASMHVGDSNTCCTLSCIVNRKDILEYGASVVETSTEPQVRDDVKLKSKGGDNHGEKEWRPKCLPVTSVGVDVLESPSTSSRKQSGSPVSTAVLGDLTGAAERAGCHLGNPSGIEIHDYEAQRTRMKEIAAHRALQLRKEENERIKGQKAKAAAKLEELNRRSLEVSVSKYIEEPSPNTGNREPLILDTCEETAAVTADAATDSSMEETVISELRKSWPRGICNDRNDDRKHEHADEGDGHRIEEQGMEMGDGSRCDTTEGKLLYIDPPLYQEVVSSQALSPCSSGLEAYGSPIPAAGVAIKASELAGHLLPQARQQELKSRGKQSASYFKLGVKHFQASLNVESSTEVHDRALNEIGKTGAILVEMQPPVIHDPEVTTILNDVLISREGSMTARKRKAKLSGRSKHKIGALCVSTDPSKPITVSIPNLTPSNETRTDTKTNRGESTLEADLNPGPNLLKNVPSLIVSDEGLSQGSSCEAVIVEDGCDGKSTGSDVVSLKPSGGLFRRTPQGKSQLARRAQREKEKGISQDVRLADRHPGAEGMTWAPVKSMPASYPADSKAGIRSDSVGSRGTSRERKEETVAPQTRRARRAELERYVPKLVVKQQAQGREELQETGISVLQQGRSNLVNGSARSQTLVDTKQEHAHTSSRLEMSEGERLREGAYQMQHQILAAEGGGTSLQSSHVTQIDHCGRSEGLTDLPTNCLRRKPDQMGTRQPSPCKGEEELQHLAVPQQVCASHSCLTAPIPAATEGVTPYQRPREVSSEMDRGCVRVGDSPHEHNRFVSPLDQGEAPSKFNENECDPDEIGEALSTLCSWRETSRSRSGSRRLRSIYVQRRAQGESTVKEKDQRSLRPLITGQARQSSQFVHGQDLDANQGHDDNVGVQGLASSPGRQYARHLVVSHKREQTIPVAQNHLLSGRGPAQEKRNHRKWVLDSAFQQQQRDASDGQMCQTLVASSRVVQSCADLTHSNEHSMLSSRRSLVGSEQKDYQISQHPNVAQHPIRIEAHSKSLGTFSDNTQKHSHYERSSRQQTDSQGVKPVNAHNSSYLKGACRGSPPPRQSRDNGHSRRERSATRHSVATQETSVDIETKKKRMSRQQFPLDAAKVVSSQLED